MRDRFGIGRSRLRNKIIAYSFVPTLVILLAVALVNFYSYQRVTEDLVIHRDERLVSLSALQLAAGLTEYTNRLEALARRAEIYEESVASQRAALRQAAKRLSIFDAGVVILNSTGLVVASEPERLEILGDNWSDRGYFRAMLRSPGPVFSDIVADAPEGAKAVVVAVPILGYSGQFVGALAGMFRLDAPSTSAFYGGITKLRIAERGTAYLVDGQGSVLYRSGLEHLGENLARQPAVEAALGSDVSGYLRTRDEDSQEALASYASIPGTPWHLVTLESWSGLMSFSQGYRQFLLLLLALGVVVPVFLVGLTVRHITRPISELIAGAKEVASGNFGRVIDASTGDEIGELAEQFNQMSAQLADSYATLERKVADRTRELGALNTMASVVSGSLDLEEVLSSALEHTLSVMSMEAGAAFLIDDSGQTVEMIAHRGISNELAAHVRRLRPPGPALREAVGEREPIVRYVSDYPEGPIRSILEEEGWRLVVSVPLMAKGRALGAVALATATPREITAEEVSLLIGIGHQTGLAVENASLYERAEQSAAAAERSRLARDLHDAVTQTLFSASLISEVLPRIWERNPDEGRRRLEQLRHLTRGALAEMRTLLLELRPSALTEAALPDLLRQLAEAAGGRAQLPVAVSVEGERPLPPEVQIALYRIAQEALNNVIKHSGASAVEISYRRDDEGVELTIKDDGRGFQIDEVGGDHLGLGIMTERAEAVGAGLRMRSAPGAGTEVLVNWKEPKS